MEQILWVEGKEAGNVQTGGGGTITGAGPGAAGPLQITANSHQ